MIDKEKLKKEISEIINETIKETIRAIKKETPSLSLKVEIPREELEESEPSNLILRDITNVLKESIRRSLRERGEAVIEEIIMNLPENKATLIMKSLANEDRIKILKILYTKPRTFTELKEMLNLEASSLSYNLRQLLSTGLIYHGGTEALYKISTRGRLLLRLLALMYETLGGEIYE